MRTFKNRYKRFLNEGMSWEDKYEEVLKLLKRHGWNDVIKDLDRDLDGGFEDNSDTSFYDSDEDIYCNTLSRFDDTLATISKIINK